MIHLWELLLVLNLICMMVNAFFGKWEFFINLVAVLALWLSRRHFTGRRL